MLLDCTKLNWMLFNCLKMDGADLAVGCYWTVDVIHFLKLQPKSRKLLIDEKNGTYNCHFLLCSVEQMDLKMFDFTFNLAFNIKAFYHTGKHYTRNGFCLNIKSKIVPKGLLYEKSLMFSVSINKSKYL